MPRFTCDDVQRITSGRWLREGRGDAPQAVSTDTRQLGGGELFIALRGERFDAHDYLAEAVRRGAGALVVDDADKAAAADTGKVPMLLVDDAVAALQALARAGREALGGAGVRVISGSGSNRKTTTRHLVHAVLTAQLVGSQSPKSFNNHLGVPLTLLGARAQDDFVVVEIGTNHMGEVAQLGAIVRPDIAVITSIGREHMEHFQTLANVAAEEAAILAHVAADGVIIAPGDEPQLAGAVINLPVPLRSSANTALAYDVSAALSTVYISMVGFQSKA